MSASSVGRESATVATSWTPVRAEPSHRSELVTQWLCGELLERVEQSDAWVRARGEDGYEGWTTAGPLLELTADERDRWRLQATCRSLGVDLVPADRDAGGSIPHRLPWGARSRMLSNGLVELPGGSRARPVDAGRLVLGADLESRFPATGRAALETAASWVGAPYLWGGRTLAGADCSGFVQAVYAVHGCRLPRDSRDQHAAGPHLGRLAPEACEPGDLLFFTPEGDGITHVGIAGEAGRILHAAAGNGDVRWNDLGGAARLERVLATSLVAVTRPIGS